MGLLLMASTVAAVGFAQRGWNTLADPDEGYTFNYPQEFRLSPAKALTFRELKQRAGAVITLESLEPDRAPTAGNFGVAKADIESSSAVKELEREPLWIILRYTTPKDVVHRKLLIGTQKVFVLTIRYPKLDDEKKATANDQTAVRIAKTLRRIG
jgi:hypothetical protein